MFGNYVYEKSTAQYLDRILLIDDDNLGETTNYSSDFLTHGFKVIKYTDDLSFRIDYEETLKKTGVKLLIVARSDQYIPYDVKRMLSVYVISLTNLFPKLNADLLKEKSALDLDLLCLAYRSDYDDRRKRSLTEHFFRSKVYTKTNVNSYLTCVLNKLMVHLDAAIFYKDWFSIAEKKAKVDVLAVEYDLEIDTSEINYRFKDYALLHFGKLSQIIDKATPVLISKAMEYMYENSSKFVIIVMDGMSVFDWYIISKSFYDIPYEQTAAFAMIPTTTSVSRQCLLSNKYPSQLIEPWRQNKEKAEFIACAKEFGFADEQIAYSRGYDVEFSSIVRCGVVIINDVDDIVHAQQQGRIGMFNDITVLSKQAKLAGTVKRFLTKGYDIYITSDHGNTICKGLGKLMGTGVEMETKSRRMLVLKDFADKASLLEKYSLIDYPKYYLMKEYDYLTCDVGDSFDSKGEDVISHGGITLDEVVVPFIKIKAEN